MKRAPLKSAQIKKDITQKLKSKSNSIEVRYKSDPLQKVVFDHSTGHKIAFGFDVYGNGYTECWSNIMGIDAHRDAFYQDTSAI